MILETLGQYHFFHMIFVLSLFAIIFEIIAGGLFFGTFSIVGFIFIIYSGYFSIISILLVALGMVFIVLEVYYSSRALFFITGCIIIFVSFFISPEMINEKPSRSFLIVSIVICAIAIGFFYLAFRKIKTLTYQHNIYTMGDKVGIVLEDTHYANIDGAYWKIFSEDTLKQGDKIKVISEKDLTLQVKKED